MQLDSAAPNMEQTSSSTDVGIRQSMSSLINQAGPAKAQETVAVVASVTIGNTITPWVTEAAKNVGQSLVEDGLVSASSLAIAGVMTVGYTGAGYPSTAGELAGGFVGKEIGRAFGGNTGGKIGKELGAVGGATTVGATAGAVVAGPMGALGGAGAGLVGYGLGKITGRVVDKVAKWEGLAQNTAPYLLKAGKGSCDRDAAAFCIVTEEGIGRCYYYCFEEEADAQKRFNGWMCSRILFRMAGGCVLEDIRRGGWPWHQASILKAADRLRSRKARMRDSTVVNCGQTVESSENSSSSSSSSRSSISSSTTSDDFETCSRRTLPDEVNASDVLSPASNQGGESADTVPRSTTSVVHRGPSAQACDCGAQNI
mmetsp:Transcript_79989/g.158442  ORF Transcript_79989/g.158442 Transcript_79989/m.158442 type:complete len:370 (+) Transcript_79989:49-1158(+)